MSEAVAGQNEPMYYDTLPPDAIFRGAGTDYRGAWAQGEL